MKMIDWEAYRKGLDELKKSTTDEPTAANAKPRLPASANTSDPGAELLRQQARQAGVVARNLAAGSVGLHLGDLAGGGDAPVADYNEKPVFEAFNKHDQLQRLLGDRLTQNYRQQLSLQAMADRQAAADEARAQRQLAHDAQLLKQQQHRLLLEAAISTPAAAQKAAEKTAKTGASTAARRTSTTGRTLASERPYRIADTDGQTLRGYWNLTPDEAAQILQTAIDLGDQAQLDYVARLMGAGTANRQTTSAQVMALRQKAMSGNASARQRMVQLLTAIIPSLRGKKVIDGILNARYERQR